MISYIIYSLKTFDILVESEVNTPSLSFILLIVDEVEFLLETIVLMPDHNFLIFLLLMVKKL